jgi:hypothetical protein
MNSRVFILFAAWIAVGVAFYLGHPIGYTVILLGLAASVAIAEEVPLTRIRVTEARSSDQTLPWASAPSL